MLSSKLLRLLIGSHQFHHELRGGLNPIARRGFACTPGGASPRSEEFHLLDKDVTILKTRVNDIKLDLKDLHRTIDKKFDDVGRKFDDVHRKIDVKFDRLMLLIVGCVVLKGGFDIYREEHKGFTGEKKA
ncbi:hypothetical protein C7212DRAFT_348324 [Tuber magnatum]|uniref:t-SNARE coiled-coil homology domain-containing protein n=1 Tax=Tuber magnatum TaxID=42249 RepID=A0A317SGF9_9PEZI|nr:hypothetical protein C7212DRAFT_348324 [Tuber magnatum]